MRNVEVGTITTKRRRGGRLRTRRRLWINLHALELERLRHQALQRQTSLAALIRWTMQQPDPEAALQSLTGLTAEDLLALPTSGPHTPWRRRSINW